MVHDTFATADEERDKDGFLRADWPRILKDGLGTLGRTSEVVGDVCDVETKLTVKATLVVGEEEGVGAAKKGVGGDEECLSAGEESDGNGGE